MDDNICPCCGGQRPAARAPLSVSLQMNTVYRGLAHVVLTPTEAEVAYVLARAWPEPAHRERIMARVWPDGDVYEKTIDVYIYALRRKLAPLGLRIVARYGVGYAIEAHADVAAHAA